MSIETNDGYDDEYNTCEKTHASLRIMHDDLLPEEISRLLGIEPTWAWHKGELRKGKYLSRIGIWGFTTKNVTDSRDLRRHLDWIIGRFNGKEDALQQLRDKGYETDVFCFWVSTGQGGPTISPRNMKGLSALGLELGFDIYWHNDEPEVVEIADE